MREINLLDSVPKSQTQKIEKGWRIEENKKIAKLYGKEFFDGERVNGYGGYYYDGRWKKVAQKLKELYNLNQNSAVLDVGCAKSFLLYDLQELIPGIKVAGLDISEYAINKAMEGYAKYLISNRIDEKKAKILEEEAIKKILPHLIIGSAEKLPFPDNSFDVVLSIDTIHNLPRENCAKAIKEMIRICKNKRDMFIKVDAYRNKEEKERMEAWVLTAETSMSTDEWLEFFKENGYDGDYFWTLF